MKRNRWVLCALAALAVLATCTPPASAPTPPRPAPAPARTIRTVSIVGALIAPSKLDGRPWDGMGDPSELIRGVAGILASGSPYAAVAAQFAGPVAAALDKPDIAGEAELYINGYVLGSGPLAKVQDSFTPQWSDLVWPNVDLEMARVRVTLWDLDLMANDPVGVVEIDARELLDAATAGGVVPVRVDAQNAQVLFVSISVM